MGDCQKMCEYLHLYTKLCIQLVYPILNWKKLSKICTIFSNLVCIQFLVYELFCPLVFRFTKLDTHKTQRQNVCDVVDTCVLSICIL